MPNNSLRLNLIVVLALAALVAGGCRTYAYRARIIGGPVQPGPAIAVAPPAAAPQVYPPPPAQVPEPGGPRPLIPATPQPMLPTTPGTAVQSNLPTQPPLVSAGIALEKVGPSQATVGALVTYRIEIQAASGGARDVTVNDQLTPGLAYASSTPMASVQGDQLQWRLGDLRGGELRTIEVNFRAERPGVFNNCAVARTADGQTSQDCASTAVVVPELDVQVSLRGSDTVMVGEPVTFEITVTNRSSLPATGLMITDHFDAGLVHEAAASPIEKDLGQLAGGQSTTIGVTFRVAHAGRLCNRVEVRGESGVRGAAEACVTAMMAAPPAAGDRPDPTIPLQPPPVAPPPAQGIPASPTPATPETPSARLGQAAVQVKVSGPAAPQQVDAVAEFTIEISNPNEAPLTNVTLIASPDAALEPVQATDGYQWDDAGNLFWKFPSLAGGKSLRVQLNCRTKEVSAQACTRVKVSTQEGATAQGEGCVEISRGESKLSMTLIDLADPVAVGKDLTYEIRVTNNGTAPARNVALLVVVPAEMSVIRLGTIGERTTYDIDDKDQEPKVRFKPVAELLPNEKLTFRVRVRAKTAGEVMVEAVLGSDGLPRPMSVTEKTTVFDEGK